VDDEAQLHLSCHGAGGPVTKARIATSGLRGCGARSCPPVPLVPVILAAVIGPILRVQGGRGKPGSAASTRFKCIEGTAAHRSAGSAGSLFSAGRRAAGRAGGPARGRAAACEAGYRCRVVAASSLVHAVAASLLVSAVSRKEPFMARARTGTGCPR
jgi:hypothetical protein